LQHAQILLKKEKQRKKQKPEGTKPNLGQKYKRAKNQGQQNL
jgi:hypothetical protein